MRVRSPLRCRDESCALRRALLSIGLASVVAGDGASARALVSACARARALSVRFRIFARASGARAPHALARFLRRRCVALSPCARESRRKSQRAWARAWAGARSSSPSHSHVRPFARSRARMRDSIACMRAAPPGYQAASSAAHARTVALTRRTLRRVMTRTRACPLPSPRAAPYTRRPPSHHPSPQAPAAAAALTLATALPAHASSSASLDNFIGSLVAGGLLFAAIAGAVVFVSTFDPTSRK